MENYQWQKVPDPVERRHIAVMPEVDDAAGAGGASRLATRFAPGLKDRGLRRAAGGGAGTKRQRRLGLRRRWDGDVTSFSESR